MRSRLWAAKIEGEEAGGKLVDLDIGAVDAAFGFPDTFEVQVAAFDKTANAGVDGGFDHAAHFEQLVLEVVEFGDEGPHGWVTWRGGVRGARGSSRGRRSVSYFHPACRRPWI